MVKRKIGKCLFITGLLLTIVNLSEQPVVYAQPQETGNLTEVEIENRLFQSESVHAFKNQVLNNSLGPSDNQSSGVYKRKEETISIYVDENTDQESMPTYTITPIVLNTHIETNTARIPLNKGENIISNEEEGIIHFQNESKETSQGGLSVIIRGGTIVPRFILGEMTDEDWAKEILKYPEAPGFELVGKKTLITGGKENRAYIGSPTTLMTNTDKIVDSHDQTSGLDNSSELHRTPRGIVQHMRETDTETYMYAWLYHTGYSQSIGMREMLKGQGKGWGPMHELGHTYQVNSMDFGELTEVTVNIYSLRAQKAFGETSRLESENIYSKAFAHIESGENFNNINDIFVKLTMFWQLELAFGEEFYPKLHQLYREEAKNLSTDDEKLQYFILSSSKISNRNLAPFCEKWGLEVTNETLKELEKYPALEHPIWTYRDSTDHPVISVNPTMIEEKDTVNSSRDQANLSENTSSDTSASESTSDEAGKIEEIVPIVTEKLEYEMDDSEIMLPDTGEKRNERLTILGCSIFLGMGTFVLRERFGKQNS